MLDAEGLGGLTEFLKGLFLSKMNNAQFWLIAGPNGAGKSTLAKSTAFSQLVIPKPLNPDDVTFGLLRQKGFDGFPDAPYEVQMEASIQAANWIYSEVEKAIEAGIPVGVETVLSTTKYLPLFQKVAQEGGEANLIYIGNEDPFTSIRRVAIRVAKGGHDVPREKIVKRWHRSLEILPRFWEIATQAWLFDYSDDLMPFLIGHKRTTHVGIDSNSFFVTENVLANAILNNKKPSNEV